MSPRLFCVVGSSDAGKTTLVEKLVREAVARGYRVGTIKHDGHGFELDREGKDSWRHKRAGAHTTVISSAHQVGVVRDVEQELGVEELISAYLGHVDLVVVEGYKRGPWPKLEVHRAETGRPLVSSPDGGLLAVATDEPLEVDVPQLGLDDAAGLLDTMLAHIPRV